MTGLVRTTPNDEDKYFSKKASNISKYAIFA